MKDFSLTIITVIIMFSVLALEHHSNVTRIQERDDLIFQLQSSNDSIKYELGQCHLLVTPETPIYE